MSKLRPHIQKRWDEFVPLAEEELREEWPNVDALMSIHFSCIKDWTNEERREIERLLAMLEDASE